MRLSSTPAWSYLCPMADARAVGASELLRACAVLGTARTKEWSHGRPAWMSWCEGCTATALSLCSTGIPGLQEKSWEAGTFSRNAPWALPLLCFQRPPYTWEILARHRNTEWSRLEGTSGNHLGQPPAQEGLPRAPAQDCAQTASEHQPCPRWVTAPSAPPACRRVQSPLPTVLHAIGASSKVPQEQSQHWWLCAGLEQGGGHFYFQCYRKASIPSTEIRLEQGRAEPAPYRYQSLSPQTGVELGAVGGITRSTQQRNKEVRGGKNCPTTSSSSSLIFSLCQHCFPETA